MSGIFQNILTHPSYLLIDICYFSSKSTLVSGTFLTFECWWLEYFQDFSLLKLSYFIRSIFRDNNNEVLSGPAAVDGSTDSDDELSSPVGRELKGETAIYYQSLIDQRDCPYIVSAILAKYDENRIFQKLIIKLLFIIPFKISLKMLSLTTWSLLLLVMQPLEKMLINSKSRSHMISRFTAICLEGIAKMCCTSWQSQKNMISLCIFSEQSLGTLWSREERTIWRKLCC